MPHSAAFFFPREEYNQGMEEKLQEKLWFRAKRYGYGWIPCSWEGWLVMVFFLAFVLSAVNWNHPVEDIGYVFVVMAGALAAVLVICVQKGETVHWYWGNRPAEPLRERNHWTVFLLFLIPFFLACIGCIVSNYVPAADSSSTIETQMDKSQKPLRASAPTLLVNGKTIYLEVADTPALREQGLSGHAPLGNDSGMLFVFEEPSSVGFWMKDMLFPLDMIWLDKDYRVISIKKDATPDSYPAIFYPSAPASYVLELPAGFADAHQIVVGSTLNLSLSAQ